MENRSISIGERADRVDGKAKVTGTARYAAEYRPGNTLFGVLVTSTIAKGRIVSINISRAERVPGVITILSHLNRPVVPAWQKKDEQGNKRLEGQEFRVFYD